MPELGCCQYGGRAFSAPAKDGVPTSWPGISVINIIDPPLESTDFAATSESSSHDTRDVVQLATSPDMRCHGRQFEPYRVQGSGDAMLWPGMPFNGSLNSSGLNKAGLKSEL